MKKSNTWIFLAGCFAFGAYLGLQNKKVIKNYIKDNNLTISNYINRLKEFDLTQENESANFFYDLIEMGFDLDSAFEIVKKECAEAKEFFND